MVDASGVYHSVGLGATVPGATQFSTGSTPGILSRHHVAGVYLSEKALQKRMNIDQTRWVRR
jgi:hypothetical protein